MLTILNRETAETERLVRDVCHTHPVWVHKQLGTKSESDLQLMLDCIDEAQYAARPECPDESGIFMGEEEASEYLDAFRRNYPNGA